MSLRITENDVGKEFLTRNGNTVSLLCYDSKDEHYPAVFESNTEIYRATISGFFWQDELEDSNDVISRVEDRNKPVEASETVNLSLTLPSGTKSFTGQIRDNQGGIYNVTLERVDE